MNARQAVVDGSRLSKFLSVGAVGAVIDLSISALLTLSGVLPAYWAKLVGAECAIVVMFVLNDRWTFSQPGRPPLPRVFRRFLTSNLVRTVGLAVQFGVVWRLVRLDVAIVFAGQNLWPLLTLVIAIGCSVIVNYVLESRVTFRVPRV